MNNERGKISLSTCSPARGSGIFSTTKASWLRGSGTREPMTCNMIEKKLKGTNKRKYK